MGCRPCESHPASDRRPREVPAVLLPTVGPVVVPGWIDDRVRTRVGRSRTVRDRDLRDACRRYRRATAWRAWKAGRRLVAGRIEDRLPARLHRSESDRARGRRPSTSASGAERVLEATAVETKYEGDVSPLPPGRPRGASCGWYSGPEGRAWDYEGWSWSPDGRSIVMLERCGTRPLVVDVQTGEATELPWEADSAPSWQRMPPVNPE